VAVVLETGNSCCYSEWLQWQMQRRIFQQSKNQAKVTARASSRRTNVVAVGKLHSAASCHSDCSKEVTWFKSNNQPA